MLEAEPRQFALVEPAGPSRRPTTAELRASSSVREMPHDDRDVIPAQQANIRYYYCAQRMKNHTMRVGRVPFYDGIV